MINYLNSDPRTDDMLDDIRTHAVFPCDKGGKYCITELYLPHPDVQKLSVPVLNWPHMIDRDSEHGTYLPDCSPSPATDCFRPIVDQARIPSTPTSGEAHQDCWID
jgi:hypothetical protein